MARATPDFFSQQRAARRRTALLLAWFALALVAVIALVYAALALPLLISSGTPRFWSPKLLAFVSVAVLGTTVAGCAYHAAALARGGAEGIVTALGGRRVDPSSGVAEERRLLNVVEEMAIASGLPVPQVFVLPQEEAINALAAGAADGGAAVAVTAGALARLSRDELQGVVAHEFSHLLGGDAVLNARLLGMLGGLTIIDLFGREALRLAWSLGRWRAGAFLLPTGLVLAAAGSIGVLCGQLVRCGVSRQREFLADAAAVQLTRNPGALARALARIRDGGSVLRHARALEASHFFFGNALGGAFGRWLATHPPLEERIRRLDPSALRPAASTPPAATGARAVSPGAASLLASIGAPQPGHLDRAAELLGALPPAVATAARSPGAAGALVLALALADEDGSTRAAQLRWLGERDAALAAQTAALGSAASGLAREHRLVALDVALAALDAAPAPARSALHDQVAALPRAGGSPTVFAWMLHRVTLRRMESRPSAARQPEIWFRAPAQVEVEALQLLSLVAWSGTRDAQGARAAVEAGARELGAPTGWRPLPRETLDVAMADGALRQLDHAAPSLKQALLRACAAAASVDDRITAPEAELLRAISVSLGCPMPPVLPGAVGTDSVDSREWRTAMPK